MEDQRPQMAEESGGGLGLGALLLPWLSQGCGSVRETPQGSSGL